MAIIIIKLLPPILGVLGTLLLILDSQRKLGIYGVLGTIAVYLGLVVYAGVVSCEQPWIGAGVVALLAIGSILYLQFRGPTRRKDA